jgi:hypothetical protein
LTYQGVRARPIASENGRYFAVSQVRLDAAGHVSDVRWNEVDAKSDHDASAPVSAAVADVVDALHDGAQVAAVFAAADPALPERLFVVLEHGDGSESIALDSAASPGRGLSDIVQFGDR